MYKNHLIIKESFYWNDTVRLISTLLTLVKFIKIRVIKKQSKKLGMV